MQFAREAITQKLCDEIFPLLMSHWEEIAHYKDIPLDPDFEQYIKLDELGVMRAYTARDKDGTLIGYAVYFVKRNIHYKNSLQAVQDVLYIHPSRRGTGGRLIKWCDNQLKDEGVDAVYHHIKSQHNFGPLLERLGYSLVDLIYSRRL